MRNHLRLGCFALTFMLAALPAAADRDRRFSNADLRGSYGWALDGTFFGTSLDGIRQFTADGEGTFSGEGTVNIGDGGLKHTWRGADSLGPVELALLELLQCPPRNRTFSWSTTRLTAARC